MARGNWNPEVIKPKARCRFCRHVVKNSDFVRVEGIYPAHRECARTTGRTFTEGTTITPRNA